MEWLVLLLIPVAVLIFAVHVLQMSLLWREVKAGPRRLRDMHGRQTLGYVLLAIAGFVAALSVLALTLLVWREERRRRARRAAGRDPPWPPT
jgi:hypothetical protein